MLQRPVGEWVPSVAGSKEVTDEEVLEGVQRQQGETPWYCPHCDVSLTNDIAYLDHINGKKHLKRLGFSTRVRFGARAAIWFRV